MTPETDHILLNAIGTLTTAIAPDHPTAFGQGQLGLISALLYFAAVDFDRAADIRANENCEMRSLFADAARAPLEIDDDLRRALSAAGTGGDAELRISTLNAANRELKALLVRLHEFVEKEKGTDAAVLEERIWRLLRVSAEARALDLPEIN